MLQLLVLSLFCAVVLSSSSDVIGMIRQQDGCTQFAELLSQRQELVDLLNNGTFTVAVPTDDAMNAFMADNEDFLASNSSLDALIDYHVMKDAHPSESFTNLSTLVTSMLTDVEYTNVTGGQRIELGLNNGKPAFLTAVKTPSTLIRPDLFYQGGLIHVVDSVLTIPISFPATITQANLTYLTALLTKGGWLNADSFATKLTLEVPDLTIFAPNNPAYGANFQGWDSLNQQELNDIFSYHVVPQVIYTPDMTNNTQYQTLANVTVTVTTYGHTDGTTDPPLFVDQALITGYNYLTANGVFQIIDQPLNVKTPEARPNAGQINSVTTSNLPDIPTLGGSKSIGTPVIVGVVIGALALIIGIGLATALCIRTRRRLNNSGFNRSGAISSQNYRYPPPQYQEVVDQPSPRSIALGLDPERPRSVARSIRGTFFPTQRASRPPRGAIVELDAKDSEKPKPTDNIDVVINEVGLVTRAAPASTPMSPLSGPLVIGEAISQSSPASPAPTAPLPPPPTVQSPLRGRPAQTWLELDGSERSRSSSLHFNARSDGNGN